MRAGALYARNTAEWRFRAGLHLVTGTLDGSRFNEEVNTDFRATRILSDAASIELRLRHDEIRGTETMFEGIDVRNDILANLDGSTWSYAMPGLAFMGQPANIMTMEMRDPGAFVSALEKLAIMP